VDAEGINSPRPSTFVERFHIFDRVVPILLFCLALAIRLPAVDRGLPFLDGYAWDDPFIMNPAVDTVRTGKWDPEWQLYPGGPIHLHTLVAGYTIISLAAKGKMVYPATIKTATDTKYFWTVGLPEIYRNSRVFQAILVSLAIVVLYFIGRTHFGPGEGIVAALLAALATQLIEVSVQIKPDAPALLASSIVLWLSLWILESRDSWGRYLVLLAITGFACGVAAGMKYNAILCLLVPVAACCLNPHHQREPVLIRLFAILLASALGFVMTSPFAIIRFDCFIQDIARQSYIYAVTTEPNACWLHVRQYVQDLVNGTYGYTVAIFVLLGFGIVAKRNWRQFVTFVTYWFAVVYVASSIGYYYHRNYVVGHLMICTFAGVGFVASAKWVGGHLKAHWKLLRILAIVIMGIAFYFLPAQKAFTFVKKLTLYEDSRNVLLNRLAKEFRPEEKIAIDEHLRVVIPETWKGPTLILTNVFNKPFKWFQDQGIKYVVIAERFEARGEDHESRTVTNWMNTRFASLRTVLKIDGGPCQFRNLLENPTVLVKSFDSYTEPAATKRVLPAVAMQTTGRAFLRDHMFGSGVELWSKGILSGVVDLDTTCTRLRLWGASYWRHPSHACITISVAEQKNQAVRMKLAEDLTIVQSGPRYAAFDIPCALGPGQWQITVDFVNGEDPLPLFEEKNARRLGVSLLEFIP
jgi:hypothetical protein